MAAVIPTDRLKLVRNRCVIEVFGGISTSSLNFFISFSHGIGAFVIGLIESDLFPFLALCPNLDTGIWLNYANAVICCCVQYCMLYIPYISFQICAENQRLQSTIHNTHVYGLNLV